MSELDDLLKSLRAERPRLADVARWKSAVAGIRSRKASRWVELVAAVLVGVLIGSTVFNRTPEEESVVNHATFERVITKIE